MPLCDPATCPPRHEIELAVTVSEALEGLARVVSMLRQRGYATRRVSADFKDGEFLQTVYCTVEVRADQTDLLLHRVERLCSVVRVQRI